MVDRSDLRVAWLVPEVELGAYWQPVLREFTKVFKNTVFYTGRVWSGFDPTLPGASAIQLVGETKFVETEKIETGYDRGFIAVSPSIISQQFSLSSAQKAETIANRPSNSKLESPAVI